MAGVSLSTLPLGQTRRSLRRQRVLREAVISDPDLAPGRDHDQDPGRSSDIYCRSTRRKREGFVMLASVEGVGKRRKPEVEVGATHVTCTEDAAAHVALAAAVDLSLDACKLFSHKLRKE